MVFYRFLLFFIGASFALQAQSTLPPAAVLLPLLSDGQARTEAQARFVALHYPLLYASASPDLNSENLTLKKGRGPLLASLLKQAAMPDAFFCKLELKIDKAANINCRFRLGSVDYVDYLEGKRRTY